MADEDAQQLDVELAATLTELWRRQPTFREPVKWLAVASPAQVSAVRAATADRFDSEDPPPEGLAGVLWPDLQRALTSLYVFSRVRHGSVESVTSALERVIGDDLSTTAASQLSANLRGLLSPDRLEEHRRITRRTAESSGPDELHDVDIRVDFRVQPAFPDERLQLVPILLARLTTWDRDDETHRALVFQISDAAAMELRLELDRALKQRDDMAAVLRQQDLT